MPALLILTTVTGALLLLVRIEPRQPAPAPAPRLPAPIPAKVGNATAPLEAEAQALDASVWWPEREGQRYAARIEHLWESLQGPADALDLLARAPANALSIAPAGPPEPLPHGIHRRPSLPQAAAQPVVDWPSRIRALARHGWQLTTSEWRHRRFEPASGDTPPTSWFEVHLDLSRPDPPARAQVSARLRIEWPILAAPAGTPDRLGHVVAESWEWLERQGPPLFHEMARLDVEPMPRTFWIDPVIARPSPGTRLPEFLLAARNTVLQRNARSGWQLEPLTPHHPGLIFTAVLADFTGDGIDDLLCAVRSGLVLLRGDKDGFSTPAMRSWSAPERLEYAQALAFGDIDGDGDLDVYLGQYRPPYQGGQMPVPYFDANDGPPAYLLKNDGTGRFEDATVGSGLEPRRHRRTYGASFLDLDGDGDADLLVTSDFAGWDLHANDGRGRFSDRTAEWLPESKGFGMSHATGDLDSDGRLDLLLVGMPQVTAERLDHIRLQHPAYPDWGRHRAAMGFGNRLAYGSNGSFRQRAAGLGIARAGWAWSAAVFDFNHDRHPDIHIINGHETRQHVADYETEFWLHDIHIGRSTPDPIVEAYFSDKAARTRGLGWSYGGHDRNRFFLNLEGTRFVDTSHLLGLALPADSRNVLAEDLDDDGDQDLLVTTFEVWPTQRQTIRLFENTVAHAHHWIAFDLQPAPNGVPLAGTVVRVEDAIGAQVRAWVPGEGYRSQPGRRLHFGLGASTRADRVEVRWPDGTVTVRTGLAADRVHTLVPPPR